MEYWLWFKKNKMVSIYFEECRSNKRVVKWIKKIKVTMLMKGFLSIQETVNGFDNNSSIKILTFRWIASNASRKRLINWPILIFEDNKFWHLYWLSPESLIINKHKKNLLLGILQELFDGVLWIIIRFHSFIWNNIENF